MINKDIIGFKCLICGHIYSELQAELAKFDLCHCGNIFKETGKYTTIYKSVEPEVNDET